MNVLMVLTSHDQLGNTGRKTGFWLEELAAPYYVFKDVGAEITLASLKEGVLRSIPRVTRRDSAQALPAGSRTTPPRHGGHLVTGVGRPTEVSASFRTSQDQDIGGTRGILSTRSGVSPDFDLRVWVEKKPSS